MASRLNVSTVVARRYELLDVIMDRGSFLLGSSRPLSATRSTATGKLDGTPTRARAALYHRVSTVDQNPQLGRRELRAAARRMGLRVALDVRETGKGTNNDRSGLVRVIGAAQRGDVDAVLVWKLDRFGRSAFDLLGNIRHLEAVSAERRTPGGG
jgi:predicted site-specific integrase-resolvase